MANFEVVVFNVDDVLPIDGADAIDIAKIGDYFSVIKKGQFRKGDKCLYVPEGSIVPQQLLKELGLTDRLAGPEKNRVKAIRLRGVLSQGLCIQSPIGAELGEDFATTLGITKWKPEVPVHLAGNCSVLPDHLVLHYDINDIKKYNSVFSQDDHIVMTEKIHGTLSCLIVDMISGEHYITSKGLMGKSFYLKNDEKNVDGNFYLKLFAKHDVKNKVFDYFKNSKDTRFIHVFGEGFAIQDLKYGCGKNDLPFRVFDIFVNGKAMNYDDMKQTCDDMLLERVPLLYYGKFSKEALYAATNGKETISGSALHVREGCVVRATVERYVKNLPQGRAQLKSVSDAYLLRKNEDATEFD